MSLIPALTRALLALRALLFVSPLFWSQWGDSASVQALSERHESGVGHKIWMKDGTETHISRNLKIKRNLSVNSQLISGQMATRSAPWYETFITVNCDASHWWATYITCGISVQPPSYYHRGNSILLFVFLFCALQVLYGCPFLHSPWRISSLMVWALLKQDSVYHFLYKLIDK